MTATLLASVAGAKPTDVAISTGLSTESPKFYPASFNPGVRVGADVPWVIRRGHAFVQTLHLGYFYDADLAHAKGRQPSAGVRHPEALDSDPAQDHGQDRGL